MFFTLSLPLGYSSLSLSFLFLPFASPSFFFFSNVACALTVAPALCAPARVARAMASDFRANLNVAAVVVSGTLTACGSTPLAVWGALPKRRGNAGSDSELPYHLNTFLEVRKVCVFASSRSHSHSLRNLSDSPSTQPIARFESLSLLSGAPSPSSPSSSSSSSSPSPLFVLSSSSLYFFLLFFFTSASSSLCFFLVSRLVLFCFRLS